MNRHDESDMMAELLARTATSAGTSKSSSRTRLMLLLLPIIALTIAGLIFMSLWLLGKSSPPDKLTDASANAGFSVFKPTDIPDGYAQDDAATRTEAGLVITTFAGKNGNADIVMTQQAAPERTLEDLYGEKLEDPRLIAIGRAYLLPTADNLSIIIVTTDSWITFDSPGVTLDRLAVERIATNLEQIRR